MRKVTGVLATKHGAEFIHGPIWRRQYDKEKEEKTSGNGKGTKFKLATGGFFC